jgi:hypothetical protein
MEMPLAHNAYLVSVRGDAGPRVSPIGPTGRSATFRDHHIAVSNKHFYRVC